MQPFDSPFSNKAEIKELPHKFDGQFKWLIQTPTHSEDIIGEEGIDDLSIQLDSAIVSLAEYGFDLPPEFVIFIRTSEWHTHLRSVTSCYLDLANSVLPFENGFLFRFLRDQQDCIFWYLYVDADTTDHCVVSSSVCFGADDSGNLMEEPQETEFYIWETFFERFLSRFWLENEILFAEYDNTLPPCVDEKFLKMYAQ